MTDEPERFTGSRLPADLVHLRGTDGYHQRLEWSADWELLNRVFCVTEHVLKPSTERTQLSRKDVTTED